MAHFHAPMVHLAKTASEIADEMPALTKVMEAKGPAAPIYPYGCCLSLDEGTLEKIGLDDEEPKVGDLVHFCCTAQVRAIPGERMNADGTTDKNGCVELQITHMGVPAAPDTPRADKWYGDNDGDEA